jgi:hypothetical protein
MISGWEIFKFVVGKMSTSAPHLHLTLHLSTQRPLLLKVRSTHSDHFAAMGYVLVAMGSHNQEFGSVVSVGEFLCQFKWVRIMYCDIVLKSPKAINQRQATWLFLTAKTHRCKVFSLTPRRALCIKLTTRHSLNVQKSPNFKFDFEKVYFIRVFYHCQSLWQ